MSFLERIDPLPILTREKFVSFVGAGGKTSLAEYLGQAAAARGKRAVMTTTTKIWARPPYVFFDDRSSVARGNGGQFVLIGKSVDRRKLVALSLDEVEVLGNEYDLVLIEADGAKRLPLKYQRAYEPVIPPCTELTVVVAGLDALGGMVSEQVFRYEEFSRATGISPEARITPEVFVRLFEGNGLMKDVDRAHAAVLLNKYDACVDPEWAAQTAAATAERTGVQVILSSVQRGDFFRLAS